jgi:hypothetical protein
MAKYERTLVILINANTPGGKLVAVFHVGTNETI